MINDHTSFADDGKDFIFIYICFFILDKQNIIISYMAKSGSKIFSPFLHSSQNESSSWIMKVKYK